MVNVSLTSIAIAFLGVFLPFAITLLAYLLNRQVQRANMQRAIANLYEKTISFRLSNPVVMKLCYKWKVESFYALHRQSSPRDRQWAIYYAYAELVSSFCSTVLYARKFHLLDKLVFDGYYEPLVRLLISVHYPYFSIARKGKFLSIFIRNYLEMMEQSDWDWQTNHKMLTKIQ